MTHTQLELATPSRYDAANMPRLNRQLDRVRAYMLNTGPHTLRQIAEACECLETSASARWRELKAEGWWHKRTQIGKGLFTYELRDRGSDG